MVFGGIGRKPYEFIGFYTHRLTLKNNAQRTSGVRCNQAGLSPCWASPGKVRYFLRVFYGNKNFAVSVFFLAPGAPGGL